MFGNAPDLLDEFKQFLPENGSAGGGGFSGLFAATGGAAQSLPQQQEKPYPQKRTSKDVAKDPGPSKKRRGGGDGKSGAQRVSLADLE